MDKVLVFTRDNRMLAFYGFEGDAMTAILRDMPGTRLIETQDEITKTPIVYWETESTLDDIQYRYGRWYDLLRIALRQDDQEKPPSEAEVRECLADTLSHWALAIIAAYAAGRDGNPEPDYDAAAAAATLPGMYGHGAADQLVYHMRNAYWRGKVNNHRAA